MKLWDYKLRKGWRPETPADWLWYLERKINYGDWVGLDPRIVKKYLPQLHLDQGKRLMVENYFKTYGVK